MFYIIGYYLDNICVGFMLNKLIGCKRLIWKLYHSGLKLILGKKNVWFREHTNGTSTSQKIMLCGNSGPDSGVDTGRYTQKRKIECTEG